MKPTEQHQNGAPALSGGHTTTPRLTALPTIEAIVQDIADALKGIDSSGVPFKHYQPGVGPYAEVALLKQVAARFNDIPGYSGCVSVRQRTPDLLIRRQWALEVKLARPFGDNGEPAEDWSVNLLHPYEGSTSLLGDCLKLRGLACSEQKGVVAIGYDTIHHKLLSNRCGRRSR